MTEADRRPTAARAEARFIGDVPGSFVLPDRVGAEWETRSFPFRARSVSSGRTVVTADVPVQRGERVALRFDGVGIRYGTVERPMKSGFVANLVADISSQGEVDARIGWLKQKGLGRAENRRRHPRVLPRDPQSFLVLGLDNYVKCRIRDMSRSGVAIESELQPPIGQLLAVGAVPGRVARHFDGGFGVAFIELQDLEQLEALLTLRTSREKRLAAERLGFAA
jgi:hypothetical protein